ncbi:unnamed protein product [Tilletia laevis]|nr:unnamed protein product [Tilletia laevis]
METVKRRAGFKAEDALDQDSPFAVLDEHGEAEPLDDAEQAKIVRELNELNEKANYIYRALLLFMLSLVLIVPHHHEHTNEDLIYLPAAPFYIFFFLIQGGLIFAVAYETAERMGFVKLPAKPYPQQPHRFGTAPDWLVLILEDIRLQPSEVEKKRGEDKGQQAAQRFGGRLVYVIFLTVLATPLPLLTFGAGSFTNAGWWAITPVVLAVVSVVEWMMGKVTADTQGLATMKYNYRGA